MKSNRNGFRSQRFEKSDWWFIDIYCRYKANFWGTCATFNRYCRIGNVSSSWNSRNERNNVKPRLCGRQSITGRAREELFVPLTRPVQARLENRRPFCDGCHDGIVAHMSNFRNGGRIFDDKQSAERPFPDEGANVIWRHPFHARTRSTDYIVTRFFSRDYMQTLFDDEIILMITLLI